MDFTGQWVSFCTIVEKEVRRFMRIWLQTLVPPVISMSLYFVVFGRLVGSQVQAIQGFSYMDYIVPGLVMMSVITNSYANVCSSFFNTKFQKSVEELLVSPTSNTVIIAGYVAGGVVRGMLVGLLVLGVASLFTTLKVYSIGYTMGCFFLTSLVFSLGGLANAIFAKKFDDISIVPTFILTPLTYLGGVFYSVKDLPPFWQSVSNWNPILYMINGFRFGLLGISDISVNYAMAMLVVASVLLYTVLVWLMHEGVGLKR